MKKGRTVRDFSVQQASPNALRKDKHKQFTPEEGREPLSACSLALNFGDFVGRETRTKSMYIMSRPRCQIEFCIGANNIESVTYSA